MNFPNDGDQKTMSTKLTGTNLCPNLQPSQLLLFIAKPSLLNPFINLVPKGILNVVPGEGFALMV